jgi:hypothetical protein
MKHARGNEKLFKTLLGFGKSERHSWEANINPLKTKRICFI